MTDKFPYKWINTEDSPEYKKPPAPLATPLAAPLPELTGVCVGKRCLTFTPPPLRGMTEPDVAFESDMVAAQEAVIRELQAQLQTRNDTITNLNRIVEDLEKSCRTMELKFKAVVKFSDDMFDSEPEVSITPPGDFYVSDGYNDILYTEGDLKCHKP